MFAPAGATMSVNDGRPNIYVAPCFRPYTDSCPSRFAHHHTSSVLQRPPFQTMTSQQFGATASHEPCSGGIVNTILDPYQQQPFGQQMEHLSDAKIMLEEYLHCPGRMNAVTKQNMSLPLLQQAMPVPFPFHSSDDGEESFHRAPSTTVHTVPQKIESSSPLPTPTVISQNVDASQYEGIDYRDWCHASIDYDVPSPFSDDTVGSSPFFPASEDGSSFVDYYLKKHPENAIRGLPLPGEHGSNSSLQTLPPNPVFVGAPFASYGGAQATSISLPPSENMFGYSPVVPPINLYSSYRQNDTPSAPPEAFIRPASVQSSTDFASPVVSSHSRRLVVDESDKRQRRDKQLVDMRRKGHSYKEIKRRMRFKEAESTLRGRVRVITKDKSERVRKPKWQAHDLDLLREAVSYFNDEQSVSGRRKSFRKMPWKKVSEWIKEHGGSYLFAPAACSKRWDNMNP